MVGALVGDGFSVWDWWPFVVSGDEQWVEVGPKKSYILMRNNWEMKQGFSYMFLNPMLANVSKDLKL